MIAYRFESDTLLAIGDPIGPDEELPPLLESFERFCREHDWSFAFYQARPEHRPLYRVRGWRMVHIGEDPVIRPERFSLEGPAVATLRRSVRKLERQGLEARVFVPGDNAFEPGRDTEGLLDQLREISSEWLKHHRGGEKGFCMGRFDPHHLSQVWLAVAWDPARGRAEAFCTFVPVWARRGWALDLMRRRPDAVPGATEFLIVKTVERMRERGDQMLSLSLSALARVGTGRRWRRRMPPPTTRSSRWSGSRASTVKGVFRWKEKFARNSGRDRAHPDPPTPRTPSPGRVQSPGACCRIPAARVSIRAPPHPGAS